MTPRSAKPSYGVFRTERRLGLDRLGRIGLEQPPPYERARRARPHSPLFQRSSLQQFDAETLLLPPGARHQGKNREGRAVPLP